LYKTLCGEEGGTLFMGLLVAVNTLPYRYSHQEDIIIGSPMAGREHADLEDQIGFYMNTLALQDTLQRRRQLQATAAKRKTTDP
jgi:non-ribosomal peptide synthetase component F